MHPEILYAISSAIFFLLFIAMLIAYLSKNETIKQTTVVNLQGKYLDFGTVTWDVSNESCTTFTVPSTLSGLVNMNIISTGYENIYQVGLSNTMALPGDPDYYDFRDSSMLLYGSLETMPRGYIVVNLNYDYIYLASRLVPYEYLPSPASLTVFFGNTPAGASFTMCAFGSYTTPT